MHLPRLYREDGWQRALHRWSESLRSPQQPPPGASEPPRNRGRLETPGENEKWKVHLDGEPSRFPGHGSWTYLSMETLPTEFGLIIPEICATHRLNILWELSFLIGFYILEVETSKVLKSVLLSNYPAWSHVGVSQQMHKKCEKALTFTNTASYFLLR